MRGRLVFLFVAYLVFGQVYSASATSIVCPDATNFGQDKNTVKIFGEYKIPIPEDLKDGVKPHHEQFFWKILGDSRLKDYWPSAIYGVGTVGNTSSFQKLLSQFQKLGSRHWRVRGQIFVAFANIANRGSNEAFTSLAQSTDPEWWRTQSFFDLSQDSENPVVAIDEDLAEDAIWAMSYLKVRQKEVDTLLANLLKRFPPTRVRNSVGDVVEAVLTCRQKKNCTCVK